MRRATGFAFAVLSIALAACGGGSSLVSGATEKPEAAATVDLGMEGRWTLAAPNAPTCGLAFTGAPGATEGRVTPDGGCPERFFLARRWRIANGELTIVDDEGGALGAFRMAGDRFAGKSGTETPLTLSR